MTYFSQDYQSLYDLLKGYRSVYMVNDANVDDLADRIAAEAGIECSLSICADPECKTMDTVLEICNFLLSLNAGRDALVLAVGGGTTTDIVGFASAMYKRGVKCAYVPTTLLAQVDASLGGKTGVNFQSYKNILGTFTMPEFTYICPEPLRTLTRRDLVSGYAELLKTFILGDAEKYFEAVRLLPSVTPETVGELGGLIEAAARIKEDVVAKDPHEAGLRRCLNLGHTYAHAIEWYEQAHGCEDPLTHGEAVAIGIIAAARQSEDEGIAKPGLADRLRRDFTACGLPVDLPYPMDELREAFPKDKKAVAGKQNFVLIKEIGTVTI